MRQPVAHAEDRFNVEGDGDVRTAPFGGFDHRAECAGFSYMGLSTEG